MASIHRSRAVLERTVTIIKAKFGAAVVRLDRGSRLRWWDKRRAKPAAFPRVSFRKLRRLEQTQDRLFRTLRDRERDRTQLLARLQRQQVG